MSSKRTSADPDYVYLPTAALRQRKFPSRRNSAKPTSSSTPSLRKQQSTLTQLDFCTPRSSSTVDDISDDADGHDKSRRKRRRTLAGGKRQSTLTQLDFMQPSSSFNNDEFDVFNDVKLSQVDTPVGEQQARVTIPSTTNQGGSKMSDARSAAKRGDRVDSRSPRKETYDLGADIIRPQTPKKRWKDEVPSSQSPQSIVMSTRNRRDKLSPQRSPLKERSSNIPATPLRQHRSPSKYSIADTPTPSRFRIQDDRPVFRKPALPVLRHATTIPDSDEMGPEEALSPQLRRYHSTIEDSQWESLEEEITASDHLQDSVQETQRYDAHSTADYSSTFFDPACSALDRDALRYMQTQRLLGDRRYFLDINESDSQVVAGTFEESRIPSVIRVAEQEDPDHDEQDSTTTHSPKDSPVKREDSPRINLFQDIEVVDLTSDEMAPLDDIPSPPGEDYGPFRALPEAAAEEPINSSPPPIPPSQASTVDVTQIPQSPERAQDILHAPNQHRHNGIEAKVNSSPSSVLAPPQEWISSSPIPLPPLVSSYMESDDDENDNDYIENDNEDNSQECEGRGEEQRKNTAKQHTTDPSTSESSGFHSGFDSDKGGGGSGGGVCVRKRLRTAREVLPDSLLDFSLPPPPPMSSWRRRV